MRTLYPLLICLFLAQPCIAQVVPAPSASASAPGDFLRRSQTILRESNLLLEERRDALDPRNVEDAERIARRAGVAPVSRLAPGPRPDPKLPSLGEHKPNTLSSAAVDPRTVGRRMYIFVSDSLPDQILKGALQTASETGAIVVYRGVRPGAQLLQSIKRAADLSTGLSPAPQAQIDPRIFDAFDVKMVPSVLVVDGPDHVIVSGTVVFGYALSRFESSAFGDAGSRGQTFDIIEGDFVEEMKARVAKIDFEKKKADAVARMWNNFEIHQLPNADLTTRRLFDPTVFIQDEVRSPDGQLIAPAGSSFNPLDVVPFTKIVVAFNASDPLQLAYAKKIADQALARNQGSILVTTNIDRALGQKAFTEHSEVLYPHRLYLLDDLVASRFGIQKIPSVIQSNGRFFQIDEINAQELAK